MKMKKYKFAFTPEGSRTIKKLPKAIQQRIYTKLRTYEKSENPLTFAEPLKGHPKKRFRFRIGDYRIICTLKNQKIIILLLVTKVGHRKDIYED